MVIPWKEGMEGDHTMCALVGENKTEGLVVGRLATRQRTHLIVAVKGAKPLLPISYFRKRHGSHKSLFIKKEKKTK